ncbi:MAG: TolC family protein [Thermoguttaceae bacterium]|nr:TolC family protein [Thermoguttaceae bacterium]
MAGRRVFSGMAVALCIFAGRATPGFAANPSAASPVTGRLPYAASVGTQPQAPRPAEAAGYTASTYLTQPEHLAEAGPFSNPAPVEKLVEYGLANNPEVQAARHRASALAHRIPQVESLPDPHLLTNVFLEEIQTAAGPQQLAMSLSQKFPWFGKRALRSEVAHYDALAAYSRVITTELEVAERVKKAYYDLYFVERATAETRQIEKLLEDVIEVTERRYRTGVGETGLHDVLQVQNELSKLRTSLVQLEQSARQARARLLAVLHLPQATPVATEPIADRARLAHRAEVLLGMADRWQPELEAWRREAARDRTAVEVARREYWPDVTMTMNWFQMGSAGLSPVADGRDAFSLGVGVNLPIYRNRLDAAVREAQCQAAATARRYAATQDQFHAEVQSLHAQFTEHDRVLEILQEQIVPRATETFELVAEAYRTGRADFQQLLDTYRTLLQYRIEVHRREAVREHTIASLERAVGATVTKPIQ